MIKKLLLLILFIPSLSLLSNIARAQDYSYQGKVESMVCAFCAYNVTKKVGRLPGVNVDSINVNLSSGQVAFSSSLLIKKATITKVFHESGFSLVAFNQIKNANSDVTLYSREPIIALKFSSTDIIQLDPVLNIIGSLAVTKAAKLFIKAPKASELDLRKPILAGRKSVIKVQFLPVDNNVVEMKLYLAEQVQDKSEQ
jgi:copper chaperone CopZ